MVVVVYLIGVGGDKTPCYVFSVKVWLSEVLYLKCPFQTYKKHIS